MLSRTLRFLLLPLIIATLCAACGSNGKEEQPLSFGAERYDSTALHLAVVTTKDCLPLIYAKRTGLFDSIGVKVQLAVYSSQADCDTALLGKYADGGLADKVRLATYGKRANDLQTVWTGTDLRMLFTSGTLRIKDGKALQGRTVAVAPRTADNDALNDALREATLKQGDVYRPQIADLKLRAAMLTQNQIDATILVWPFTSQALSEGHRKIYAQKKSDEATVFVRKAKRASKAAVAQQWKLLEQARKMAIDSLRSPHCRHAVSLILQKDYGLTREVADTIKLPF